MGHDTKPETKGRAPRRFLKRFLRDQSGATAIEFTALAIPFAMLTFAILESCISFAGQQLMANVTDDIGRKLRTGQIRVADVANNPTKLKQLICTDLSIIVTAGCPGLEVDLRKVDTFAEASKLGFTITDKKLVLTKDGAADAGGFKVDPGPSLSKNMLRVFYRWPVMTDFMRSSMANLEDGKTLLFSTVTWQNEPFDD